MPHESPPPSAGPASPNFLGLLRLIRPWQWLKNGFVLAPLIFAGLFLKADSVIAALAATALFCLASSITYVVNDMQDVERDRQHPVKSRKRPLASGAVTVKQAYGVLVVLALALFAGLAAFPRVTPVIAGYLALTFAYTYWLKHQPVLDIFSIAAGFVLRVYAGAVALAVPLSPWMFITTLCLALYLASIKRRQELLGSGESGRRVLKYYTPALVERYAEMSATGALVFYSMFVMSERPELALSIPFVLFGLFRYWYDVESLEGGESPTEVLMKDWQLAATIVAWCGVCAWSLWPKG